LTVTFSPWVILNDFGGAFSMGAVGGGIWYGIKGARNSPRVRLSYFFILSFLITIQGERFIGAVSSIKARAPVTGGNFGVWGGMFSTFDCAIKGWRQKEDAWNAILSGFMTGGCLALRSMWLLPLVDLFMSSSPFYPTGGPRSALGSAVACGILLGVFEGVGVLMSRVFSEGSRPQMAPSAYIIWFQNVFILSSYKQYLELRHLWSCIDYYTVDILYILGFLLISSHHCHNQRCVHRTCQHNPTLPDRTYCQTCERLFG
jgi:import inner membrane translocase subunit TIM17